jgi:hypothetical protein
VPDAAKVTCTAKLIALLRYGEVDFGLTSIGWLGFTIHMITLVDNGERLGQMGRAGRHHMTRTAGLLLAAAAMLVAAASTKPSQGARGFLFVAMGAAVIDDEGEQKNHDGELATALRGACATGHPIRVIVETPGEAAAVARTMSPCDRVDVVALRNDTRRDVFSPRKFCRNENCQRRANLRRFKLEAILAGVDAFPGGTLLLDNDVTVRRGGGPELFAVFDAMRRSKKAVGLTEAPHCVADRHHIEDVPEKFCERNGGVIFFGDAARSRSFVEEWLEEFDARPSPDGHDQLSLRRVLWRHKDALYDVPKQLQCRAPSCGNPCAADKKARPLLWHAHHGVRAKRAAAGKSKKYEQEFQRKGSICGFLV